MMPITSVPPAAVADSYPGTSPPLDWRPQPLPQPQLVQSELVQALNTVSRAVGSRIAVLQAEIDAIRKALQPFQHMGKQAPGDAFSVDGNDAVTELLNIAKKLGGGNSIP